MRFLPWHGYSQSLWPASRRYRAGDDHKASPSGSSLSRTARPSLRPPTKQSERSDRFRVPAGLNVELFAAEPLLANPVAFCIDEKGIVYVAETFRLNAGVTDTREHMNWLDDDLACRTVADRVAMYKKFLGTGFAAYDRHHDRVKRIVDSDGDGRADTDHGLRRRLQRPGRRHRRRGAGAQG